MPVMHRLVQSELGLLPPHGEGYYALLDRLLTHSVRASLREYHLYWSLGISVADLQQDMDGLFEEMRQEYHQLDHRLTLSLRHVLGSLQLVLENIWRETGDEWCLYYDLQRGELECLPPDDSVPPPSYPYIDMTALQW